MILGDTKLIIDFCNRRARPSLHELWVATKEIVRLRGSVSKPIFYRHVPRHLNALADWLTNVAREAKTTLDCTLLCTLTSPFSDPPCTPTHAVDPTQLISAITRG